MLQIDREIKNIALTESEIEYVMNAMSAIYPSDTDSEIRHKRIVRELTKALNSTNTIFE
tara:strand:- start:106 stop:282 length:177 start_codon:yes stop_codon:yes gene_type:complete